MPLSAIVLDDSVLWAVLERKFFSSQVVAVYQTRAEAEQQAKQMDEVSGLSFNKYVVQRAPLVTSGS